MTKHSLTHSIVLCVIDKYDDATANYTQYVSINGNVVHTLSTSDGHALGFGSAVECAASDCGVVPAHCEVPLVSFGAQQIVVR